jgi:aldose 1-epimerase
MNVSEYKLIAGDLEAVFLPVMGMLGASFRHRGEELLRRLENLESAADKGSTAGIPLLYPWANRLAVPRYMAGDREIWLDLTSPLLHTDDQGLLIHGVKWALLNWEVITSKSNQLVTRFEWNKPELLKVFPFRHQIEFSATLTPESLTIATEILSEDTIPVSFGFHPYFGLPGTDRSQWRLEMPAMRKLLLDNKKIPTGEEQFTDQFNDLLGEQDIDSGFALLDDIPKFSISGEGRRITLEFLENYRYAQIFAPKNKDFVALEPMTAPTSALTSGTGLVWVQPEQNFKAVFRISVAFE